MLFTLLQGGNIYGDTVEWRNFDSTMLKERSVFNMTTPSFTSLYSHYTRCSELKFDYARKGTQ
ncbi:hypothetical protein B1L02_22350 [Pseudoalteromonas piscicida]|uniref:Uncharacterized protein n=1 Tax=Pseudoalteromonas piscicida TaxID=43662 RepID=A0AAD0RLN1_PSEO7|nr:hypothetical protein B1L02_22350 [Pseudoalteromonas piscicida]AXR04034.1 hypothetical protein D0511_18905 [Pseudoalteromonas piscicida]